MFLPLIKKSKRWGDPLLVGQPHHQVFSGRDDRIRTCDILLPKQARYQTAPRPDTDMAGGIIHHLLHGTSISTLIYNRYKLNEKCEGRKPLRAGKAAHENGYTRDEQCP